MDTGDMALWKECFIFGRLAVTNYKIPHRKLKNVVTVSMIFALALGGLFVYGMVKPSAVPFNYVPPPEAVPDTSTEMSIGTMADQAFLFIIPFAVLFLVYVSVLLSTLVKNLKKTDVCHGDLACEFKKHYFS
jgi:hypothetical protein